MSIAAISYTQNWRERRENGTGAAFHPGKKSWWTSFYTKRGGGGHGGEGRGCNYPLNFGRGC